MGGDYQDLGQNCIFITKPGWNLPKYAPGLNNPSKYGTVFPVIGIARLIIMITKVSFGISLADYA
jgi:hypothetical protein